MGWSVYGEPGSVSGQLADNEIITFGSGGEGVDADVLWDGGGWTVKVGGTARLCVDSAGVLVANGGNLQVAAGGKLNFDGAAIDLDPTGVFHCHMDAGQVVLYSISDSLANAFLIDDGTLDWLDIDTSAETITLGNSGATTHTVGGRVVDVVSQAGGTLAASDAHDCVIFTASGTYNLGAIEEGRRVMLKWTGSSGSLTINADGSDTIDGAASFTLSTQYASIVLVGGAGTDWAVF